jgi:hypothetical protein
MGSGVVPPGAPLCVNCHVPYTPFSPDCKGAALSCGLMLGNRHVMYDVEPDLASRTRHRFFDMASAEKALIVGFHFPFPSLGQIEKDGAGYRLVPSAWNPVL